MIILLLLLLLLLKQFQPTNKPVSAPGCLRGSDKSSNEIARNVYGVFLREILSSRVPEMTFSAFWGVILQNSENYKTS